MPENRASYKEKIEEALKDQKVDIAILIEAARLFVRMYQDPSLLSAFAQYVGQTAESKGMTHAMAQSAEQEANNIVINQARLRPHIEELSKSVQQEGQLNKVVQEMYSAYYSAEKAGPEVMQKIVNDLTSALEVLPLDEVLFYFTKPDNKPAGVLTYMKEVLKDKYPTEQKSQVALEKLSRLAYRVYKAHLERSELAGRDKSSILKLALTEMLSIDV